MELLQYSISSNNGDEIIKYLKQLVDAFIDSLPYCGPVSEINELLPPPTYRKKKQSYDI